MSLGDEWAETTPGSASKLNQVTLTYGTGAYLATLSKSSHKLVLCTSTGSGFTLDHVYLANTAADAWIDLSDVNEHTHTDTTTGGSLIGIARSNINFLDTHAQFQTNNFKYKWEESVSGTGSTADDTDGTTAEHSILLATGATNASVATIRQRALDVEMSKEGFFKVMNRLSTASSLALKCGVGMEPLTIADNNFRKYGFELCTTVNNNYFLATANGTTRSSSDSGTAMDTNRTSFRVEHYPNTPKVDLYINEGTVFTKTSHIPTTYSNGDPPPSSSFVISIKNNTGANREWYSYAARFAFHLESKWDEN